MSQSYVFAVALPPASKGLDARRFRLILSASRADEGELSKADLAAIKRALATELAEEPMLTPVAPALPRIPARKPAPATTTKRAAAPTKRRAARIAR